LCKRTAIATSDGRAATEPAGPTGELGTTERAEEVAVLIFQAYGFDFHFDFHRGRRARSSTLRIQKAARRSEAISKVW